MHLTPADIERFWSKVQIGNSDECWEWKAGKFANGYGEFYVAGKDYGAHRVACFLAFGPIPDDCVAMHDCDNRGCVNTNPGHVHVGTVSENSRDMYAKGRWTYVKPETHWMHLDPTNILRGEAQAQSKLTDNAVRDIRQRQIAGETMTALAKEYGVALSTVWQVVRRKNWTHIT